ncbi:hypothetical protein GQ55_8G117300 [Panicum hallii var. hallii]|uniref:Uncharacterized protein n=1 Tax=Panicum hallii var. hallii TaxID=1504633 RepID=A0A2T7CMN4_9POAL|nr:hypothetical protein GQ55_8G117300 [Panicum hallii var. hallii]
MAPQQQHQNQVLWCLEVGHMPHGNMAVVVNPIAGQWPPPSQHCLPMIRKEASFPCFRKLAPPHGSGHIYGVFGVATVVNQIHGSGEPRLSRPSYNAALCFVP